MRPMYICATLLTALAAASLRLGLHVSVSGGNALLHTWLGACSAARMSSTDPGTCSLERLHCYGTRCETKNHRQVALAGFLLSRSDLPCSRSSDEQQCSVIGAVIATAACK